MPSVADMPPVAVALNPAPEPESLRSPVVAPRTRPRREDLKPGEVLCQYCTAKCCRYFALEIDKPDTQHDFEIIRWYMLHGDVAVFTEDGTWYLLVYNVCRHLQEDQRCGIYATRPQICRDYTTDNCEYDESWVYDRYLETPEQVVEYAEAVLPRKRGASFRSAKPPLLPVI
jgi:Fe-S-cluster containining protein